VGGLFKAAPDWSRRISSVRAAAAHGGKGKEAVGDSHLGGRAGAGSLGPIPLRTPQLGFDAVRLPAPSSTTPGG